MSLDENHRNMRRSVIGAVGSVGYQTISTISLTPWWLNGNRNILLTLGDTGPVVTSGTMERNVW
jgi:hypothetical protein